ncbi:SUA5 Putative translation factor (SUA5) [Candidatus Planktophila vernalis]|uniref:L-threonylcarbamoyladenylate synthase n=1 Tax=Candidatus Planktophila vernalis TaxID=1884907 RepID=UPI003CE98B34
MSAAAANLLAGNLVAFPTETVYGLGADACNAASVARVYSVKGRPADHPLIVHVTSMDSLSDWASDVPAYAIALARDFWPGPMTLIMKRSTLAADFVTGGQDTVGIRVPAHPVALGLIEAFARVGGKGVAAPSANRFGNVSPTTAQAVSDELSDHLSDEDQILDGGACGVGLESTIIDCTGDTPRILRPGAVTVEMIEESTGLVVDGNRVERNEIRVSGSLDSHYSPLAKVVLDQTPTVGQGFIAMKDVATPHGVVRLAAPQTHDEFARILYSSLRAADEQGLATVVVAQPAGNGIAIAIRDRLKRAST